MPRPRGGWPGSRWQRPERWRLSRSRLWQRRRQGSMRGCCGWLTTYIPPVPCGLPPPTCTSYHSRSPPTGDQRVALRRNLHIRQPPPRLLVGGPQQHVEHRVGGGRHTLRRCSNGITGMLRWSADCFSSPRTSARPSAPLSFDHGRMQPQSQQPAPLPCRGFGLPSPATTSASRSRPWTPSPHAPEPASWLPAGTHSSSQGRV